MNRRELGIIFKKNPNIEFIRGDKCPKTIFDEKKFIKGGSRRLRRRKRSSESSLAPKSFIKEFKNPWDL